MPFPHIVKVFNPFCLIQKLRNVIDKLLVENRKLANENCHLKLQIFDLSNKLSREIKRHSKATAIINDLKWQLEGCDEQLKHLKWQLEDCDEQLKYLDSQIEEKEQSIYDLESLLKKRDQSINDQANEIASSNKLIRDIYDLLLESRKCDF